jgi:DNA polymerase
MESPPPQHDALSLLRWYAAMGVDVAVENEPQDRTILTEAPVAAVDESPAGGSPYSGGSDAMAAPTLLTANPDAVVLAAREQARAARSLDELRETLDRFEGCALRATATRLVFADGSPEGRIMFVGEAPGREEDIRGLPFVGRSGQLLDRMLAAIGLDRRKVYIANIVPWRPPGNRTPTPQEAAICRPFLERQIELVDPKILVCLGAPSAQALLGAKEGILKLRGRWLHYDMGEGRLVQAMATLHPAYLLRQPLQKRQAWRDFRAIRVALETS